jgi:hypothetical protein
MEPQVNLVFINKWRRGMKKLCLLILGCLLSSYATANGIFNTPISPTATYTWNLPTPGKMTLYTNYSQTAIGFIYTTDEHSDMVIIRCPLNDIGLQANSTYVCWLPKGESAKIELQSYYYSHGASGSYAVLNP